MMMRAKQTKDLYDRWSRFYTVLEIDNEEVYDTFANEKITNFMAIISSTVS